MTTLENDIKRKSNSKISIIVYNDYPELVCEDLYPDSNLIDKLPLPDGNTNFDKPLMMFKVLIKKYFTK